MVSESAKVISQRSCVNGKMPRPKKWFLGIGDGENASGGAQRYLVVKTTEGLLKKPYASEPLGRIKDVSFDIIPRFIYGSYTVHCCIMEYYIGE